MPTRTRKRKASEEEGAEAEGAPLPAKKSARAAQRKPRSSEKSKSTPSSARSAKSEIRRNADELIHMMENQYDDSRSVRAGSTLSSNCTAILQDGIDTRNMVYQKSHDYIKALQDTIHGYEGANRDSTKIRKPTQGAQWEQDAKDVTKVDKKAMEILIHTLNGLILSGEHAGFLQSPSRSSDDIEQAAWRWVEGGIPPAEDTWGSSARETLKAFAGVAKLLL